MMKRERSHSKSVYSRGSAQTKASTATDQSVIGRNNATQHSLKLKLKSASTTRAGNVKTNSTEEPIVKRLFAQYPVCKPDLLQKEITQLDSRQ